MKHFYSLSSSPGTTGKKFYTNAFRTLGLDYTYTPLQCNDITIDLLNDLRKSNGFSVSMPLKQQIIKYLDYVDPLVYNYALCNTVLVKDGKLYGYNTDYYGIKNVLDIIDLEGPVSILGQGAIANMVYKILDGGATIYSRKKGNWDNIDSLIGSVINCTSLGMEHTPNSPFNTLPNISMVIDFTINPLNELNSQCRINGVCYVDGHTIYKYQFLKQLEIYTGITMEFDEL